MAKRLKIASKFDTRERAVLHHGDCLDLLKAIPSKSIQLVVTSPPYNIGKEYEKKSTLVDYVEAQKQIIQESERVLSDSGSICWQVGNFIENGAIVPLDILL